MKIIECLQGSAEWFNARNGIPTASRFCDIITPDGKRRTGEKPRKYALELAGERLTGKPHSRFVTDAMQRGKILEPVAREWYRRCTQQTVSEVGFILSDCGRYGASPDGITATGGVEIKCPGRLALLDMADECQTSDDYQTQVQGNMLVTNRNHWDFVLFSDETGLPCTFWRIGRNHEFCERLHNILVEFDKVVTEKTKRMKTLRDMIAVPDDIRKMAEAAMAAGDGNIDMEGATEI